MAFDIQNLARASVSLQEPLTTITNAAGVAIERPGCFREWMYYGINFDVNGAVNGDSFATMLAAGYFNTAAGQFQVNDVIRLYSASQLAYLTVQVTAVTSTTVSVFPLGSISGFDLSLSNANIQAMFGAPIQILPAPGAGYAYLINSWAITKTAGGAAFTGGGAINLFYDNTRTTAAATAIPATVFTTSAAAAIGEAGALAAFGVASALYINQPVYISNAGGAFATDVVSTASVYIDLKLVSL